jgi:hypothetical protein
VTATRRASATTGATRHEATSGRPRDSRTTTAAVHGSRVTAQLGAQLAGGATVTRSRPARTTSRAAARSGSSIVVRLVTLAAAPEREHSDQNSPA